MDYIENAEFEKLTFDQLPGGVREFEDCTFTLCDFQGVSLTRLQFNRCVFRDCNFALTHWPESQLSQAKFYDCKLTGARLDQLNRFNLSMSFVNCNLDHAVFTGLKIPSTRFESCMLRQTDFSDADLSTSIFLQSDLRDAAFAHTNLEYADFRSSSNVWPDPESNSMRRAKFDLIQLPGLLRRFDLDIDGV
jgi:fluoroquinolone resistance protein